MSANASGVDLPPTVSSFDELVARFEYERTERVPTEVTGLTEYEGAAVHELSYAGLGKEQRIPAFMVLPTREGPAPCVMYVHPAPGDRSTFLEEGIELARRGVGSLLVEAPWALGETWARTLKTAEYARDVYTAIVKDLRRGVDFVYTRPEFDSSRIAYVGHSFGALFGGVLSGVEKRIQAFALMAGAPSFTDLAALNDSSLHGEALEEYARVMQPVDPIYYVGHATPSALLFQFGTQDQAFSQEQLERLAEAGSEPKLVRRYETDHLFSNGEGLVDRREWLLAMMLTS